MAGQGGSTRGGPARKRVKVTQADWRETFGGPSDSLRVTAMKFCSIYSCTQASCHAPGYDRQLGTATQSPDADPQINLPGSRNNTEAYAPP